MHINEQKSLKDVWHELVSVVTEGTEKKKQGAGGLCYYKMFRDNSF